MKPQSESGREDRPDRCVIIDNDELLRQLKNSSWFINPDRLFHFGCSILPIVDCSIEFDGVDLGKTIITGYEYLGIEDD